MLPSHPQLEYGSEYGRRRPRQGHSDRDGRCAVFISIIYFDSLTTCAMIRFILHHMFNIFELLVIAMKVLGIYFPASFRYLSCNHFRSEMLEALRDAQELAPRIAKPTVSRFGVAARERADFNLRAVLSDGFMPESGE